MLFSGPTNTAGHTVIDSIFITILKSHTSMAPGEVSSALRGERRFLGEEVDICGRWDADSDCIRALVAAGVPRIPMDWKYKFCHTSALTICHCISMIGFINSYLFDQPSGLFLQNCELCGLGTNLKPSHVVVIIAFHLAQSGAQDENLFGALAVVLCMVASLTDFGETAITLGSFFFGGSMATNDPLVDECNHKEETPYGFANSVPLSLIQRWPEPTQVGWSIFCLVLRSLERTQSYLNSTGIDLRETHCDQCDSPGTLFVYNQNMRTLWGAIQTELLTYRRQRQSDPWFSSNIDMMEILRSLQNDDKMSVGRMTQEPIMKTQCHCGEFSGELPGIP